MKAVFIEQNGGPEVLKFGEVTQSQNLQPNQVLIDVVYSSVNYIDTYHRTGLYKLPMPARLGRDGAGIVAAVGSEVTEVSIGDRVCFIGPGSNATQVIMPIKDVVPVPEGVSLKDAAASMLQGLTAAALVLHAYKVTPESVVVVLAASGGTGGLIVQMAKALGATVIGTVSTDSKKEIALRHGADHVIVGYNNVDFSTTVRELTGGRGANAVYDGVGKDTWESSLKSLRKRGTCVLFGNASGPVPPIDPLKLSQLGSLFLTRPTLFDHFECREDLTSMAKTVFDWVIDNKVKLTIDSTFNLHSDDDIQQAHRRIESRDASGKILLLLDETKAEL